MPAPIYPWDDWFSRPRFTVRRGRHYACSQSSMGQQIRNAASRRSLECHIEEGRDCFVVTVVGTLTSPRR